MVEKDKCGQWLLHTLWIPKNHWVLQNCAWSTEEKEMVSWIYLKPKTSALWKTLFREWKDKLDFKKIYVKHIWYRTGL